MFNGTTNRLLEKTNEELSLLSSRMHTQLSHIDEKISPALSSSLSKRALVVNITMAAGIMVLVVLGILQQSHIREMSTLADKNHRTIELLQKVIVNNTKAFTDLKQLQQTSIEQALILHARIEKMSDREGSLLELRDQMRSQNNLMRKLLIEIQTDSSSQMNIQKRANSTGAGTLVGLR